MEEETKTCTKCKKDKPSGEFYFNKKTGRAICWCKVCVKKNVKKNYNKNPDKAKKYHKKYSKDNEEKLKEYRRAYYIKNKERILSNERQRRENNEDKYKKRRKRRYSLNKDKILGQQRKYYEKNKNKIVARQNLYYKSRADNDMNFRIKKNISRNINRYLRISGVSKQGKSVLKHLPYTMQELANHLEKQFESWMSWDNYGPYKLKDWIDNDQLTWTWQIDHIIPHSEFKYLSMDDEEFKKCWALSNLRPLNSKQNLMDGVKRKRHKRKK